jgi:hypothetical protein
VNYSLKNLLIILIITILSCSFSVNCSTRKYYYRIGDGKLEAYTYSCAVGKYEYTGFWVLDGKPYTAQYGFDGIGLNEISSGKINDTPSLEVGESYYIYKVSSLEGERIVIVKDEPTWWKSR